MHPQLVTPKNQLKLDPSHEPIELKEDKLMIWVDLAPAMRFAHPTRTILIGAESVEVFEGQWWVELDGRRFPEGETDYPSPVTPLELPSGAEDDPRLQFLPRIFAAGETILDGERKIEIEEPSLVAWIDLQPRAKYAHPTRYVIIGAHAVRVLDGKWWPTLDGRPLLGTPAAVPQPWSLPSLPVLPPRDPVHVDVVELVDAMPVKTDRRRGSVTAIGKVPTGGYSDARLDQRIYIVDPGDDIIDFDFMARPPSGIATQVISEVFASHDIPLPDIAGVRIHAERNHITLYTPMIREEFEPRDRFQIRGARFEGDQLVVEVEYGGGCQRHDFRVLWNGAVRRSNPPQADFLLTHDGHADPCRMILHETLRIDMLDLPPLVLTLRDGFGGEQQLRYRLPPP
ncbi:MAG: hypothetical protein H6712_19875 [Myxococcales bacterium]|nr:hypothetical protein [Myxococcales bacterium]MCB9716135.1 hypothetical protein [Myxococcales bacterium]